MFRGRRRFITVRVTLFWSVAKCIDCLTTSEARDICYTTDWLWKPRKFELDRISTPTSVYPSIRSWTSVYKFSFCLFSARATSKWALIRNPLKARFHFAPSPSNRLMSCRRDCGYEFEFQMKNDAIQQLTSTKVMVERNVKVGNVRWHEL